MIFASAKKLDIVVLSTLCALTIIHGQFPTVAQVHCKTKCARKIMWVLMVSSAFVHDFFIRFCKLVKTQGEPCCNSKAMGIHFAHNIGIRLVQLLLFFFASLLCPVKFTFFFQCLFVQVGVEPS